MKNPPLDAQETPLRFFRLRGCVFNFARKLAQNEAPQINSATCVVNIYSDQIALRIVVEHDALRDFSTVDARPLREVDVQRVRIGEVVEFHGLKPRSGKALCIVTLSLRVTTLKYRPPRSGTGAQNCQRSNRCGAARTACSMTCMHHSLLRYGRLERTRVSKYFVNRYSGMALRLCPRCRWRVA